MQIGIITTEKIVTPGKSIESDFIIKDSSITKNRKWFKLMPGQSDLSEIEGTDVLITGYEYFLARRNYPLEDYALRAKLTPKFELIPYLRVAKGKELKINAFWPVIVEV